MSIERDVLGIDVCGAHLDVFAHPARQARHLPNTEDGVAQLIAWAVETGAFVVLEATAPWDQLLIRALEAAGVSFHRANPKRARDFARAAGLLAKTDAVDARMLALYGARMPLRATEPIEAGRLELQGLVARRDQLVEMRKAERVRLQSITRPVLADSLKAVIALLDEQIRQIEALIERTIRAEPALVREEAVLRQVPGIGPVAASVLLAALPELGKVDRRAVA